MVKRNWKVVWWSDVRDEPRRHVIGLLVAAVAWKMFWALKGQEHVLNGPEIWRGRQRIMAVNMPEPQLRPNVAQISREMGLTQPRVPRRLRRLTTR